MPQFNILVARFPYGGHEEHTVADWLVSTIIQMKQDPRVGRIYHTKVNDTPITMSRNRVIEKAKQLKVDLVLMVDSDMAPDLYVGADPEAKPFWPTAFDFVVNHHGPCVVGAPYCGPPPHENIFIFRAANKQSDHPNVDWGLTQYTREEAATRTGVEQVAALPTGVVLIDMRAFQHIAPPYFEYEMDQPFQTEKLTTEDVFFSRNLALVGVPQYCLWDCWAGHWKKKCVGKPRLATMEDIGGSLREALLEKRSCFDRLADVGPANGALPVETVQVDRLQGTDSPAGERNPWDEIKAPAVSHLQRPSGAVYCGTEGVGNVTSIVEYATCPVCRSAFFAERDRLQADVPPASPPVGESPPAAAQKPAEAFGDELARRREQESLQRRWYPPPLIATTQPLSQVLAAAGNNL